MVYAEDYTDENQPHDDEDAHHMNQDEILFDSEDESEFEEDEVDSYHTALLDHTEPYSMDQILQSGALTSYSEYMVSHTTKDSSIEETPTVDLHRIASQLGNSRYNFPSVVQAWLKVPESQIHKIPSRYQTKTE